LAIMRGGPQPIADRNGRLMKHILIRSGKSPFYAAGPSEYLHRDLMGTNIGNLLFSDSAHKLLSTPRTEITSNGMRADPSPERAAQINEAYNVFVVPLANAFRDSFQASLDRLSTLIEQLTIPVVVLGVGAQVGADYNVDDLRPIEASVRRFVTAVLDRSASIGVRGELTASYLNSLGYRDVDIIGCPSMFLQGDTFPDIRIPEPFDTSSRIAINLSPDAIPVGNIAGLAARAQARFPHLMYFAQNLVDAELLFWGDTSVEAGIEHPFPLQISHPLFQRDQVTVPLDPRTWIEELSAYDFAYGTRIHGNIAALLAGTPAVVLAHDSRTLELCRYFEIPHTLLADLPADTEPEDLYEGADFGAMLKGHHDRFQRLTSFLGKNDLENTYDHGDGGFAFNARMATVNLPPPLRLWDGSDDGALRYRFSRLREKHAQVVRGIETLTKKNVELRKRLATAEKREAVLARRLTNLERQVVRVDKRLRGIDRRVLVRIGPALQRRIRRTKVK
jgi:Polysaccharide pyruvyl transferase